MDLVFKFYGNLFTKRAITLSATSTQDVSFPEFDHEHEANSDLPPPENQETTPSLRGTNRFLAQTRAFTTCDKNLLLCRAQGSPGPDCCKKMCVNEMTDWFNCGKCGKKCKYTEICCGGQCVNPMYSKKHCGGCNNECKKGSACQYGMCSYA
uniref:Stigma-specific STIG1-like protein 1 n=1 Tax=Salix viminalis TaxID=40686 RepID=A0A6N2N4L7_SALVM